MSTGAHPNNKIPLLKRLSLDVFRQYRRTQAHLHDLTYLFWECTLRCNLSCLHCGSDCQKQARIPDMPLADFVRVLDEVKTQYNPNKVMLALTGGEPLLRRDLEQAGKEFYRRGFPWGMVTNGFALTEERMKGLLGAGLRSITISVDGLRDSHNWLRGNPESFDRAVEAVGYAARAQGIVSDVVTCVNQRNIGELEAVRDLLIDKGVQRWRLFAIFPKGRAKNDRLLDIGDPQFKELMEFIKQTRSAGRIGASFSCEGFLGPYEGQVRDGFFFCRAGINVGSVLVDGGISACPSLRGDYVQGNIYKERFLDVWNNRFGIMRDRAWTRVGECAGCAVYKWCDGNGLHLREEGTGTVLRCHYNMLRNACAPAVH